jgi:hypothetical protein
MNNEEWKRMLINYLDGESTADEKKIVEERLREDKESQRLLEQLKELNHRMGSSKPWQPSQALHESFHAALQQEISQQVPAKQLFMSPWLYRAAAAVALLVVASVSVWWYQQQLGKEAELAALKLEMESTRRLVFTLLENQESPTQRMMGVKASYQSEQKDDAIVSALIKVMNEDTNINVRMAAIEALGRFSHEPIVRSALIESLPTQTDPVVQIGLIQVLVQIKEKEVVKSLEKIVEDDKIIQSVKDEAHAGMMKLNI